MSVFYKFKSALKYDTVQFDDLHISLQEFKKAVIQRSQPGKSTNFDLQVTNAETNEVYSEDNALIPKNSSLIVVRVPLSGSQKKAWDVGDHLSSKIGVLSSDYMREAPGSIVLKHSELAALNASEEDKIKAMMLQSNVDYDPANYSRVRDAYQTGEPPASYLCHKCQRPGHWIRECPITVVPDIKKSSGIPQSFMTQVKDPSVQGALMTPAGTFAVPTIDMQAYKEGKKEKPFIPSEESEESKPIIPDDLLCTICQDILTDAVMMPCCGNSFCDECIRNILIESEENQCPDCKEKDTSPESLIPNRFLRTAVNNFRNESGYRGGGHRVKRNEAEPTKKSPAIEADQDVVLIGMTPVEPVKKVESEPEGEKGSAIVVLGSNTSRMPTNGTQKMPTVHVEHRAPLGRPKMQGEGLYPESSRSTGIGNGIRLSPETGSDAERKKSSPGMSVPHQVPGLNRITGLPDTSQVPPGYSPHPLQSINTHYGGNIRPIMPTYGPPPNSMNPMNMPPSHMGNQSGPVRIYPPYSNQNMYQPQIGGGYRSAPNHHRIRPHHANSYGDRQIVEDPLEAFERHLRERERQDRFRRIHNRRSRSRSPSRPKSRSRSRQRSRSRSSSKKRSHSKTPPPHKESPPIKKDSRSPVARRSKSRSRSITRLRSRSLSRSPMHGSKSPSPISASKKKRTDSLSPNSVGFKKHSRSMSPLMKKSNRPHRTRSRSRSRSKSASRARKRVRSRTRSRSISSRSVSRNRSYSRSPSPRTRTFRSPSHSHRIKRLSRSPPRHYYPHTARRGGGSHYKDPSPYHTNPPNYYEQNEHRIFKRGGRSSRYPRGSNRYLSSNQVYDGGHKYDRYVNSDHRYDDKRYADANRGNYYSTSSASNDHLRNRRGDYQHGRSTAEYGAYYNNYGEAVAPPGTAADMNYSGGAAVMYNETVPPPGYHQDRGAVGGGDRYRRSPAALDYDDRSGLKMSSSYKDGPPAPQPMQLLDEYRKLPADDYRKPRDYESVVAADKERRRSRDRHHSRNRESESRHRAKHRSGRSASPAAPLSSSSGHRGADREHRSKRRSSRGRSADKENRVSSRTDRGTSHKRESSADRGDDDAYHHHRHRHASPDKRDASPDAETAPAKRGEADDAHRSGKDEYKEKKEKSKRKKKKESEVEKKKRKKQKTSKKEEAAAAAASAAATAAAAAAAAAKVEQSVSETGHEEVSADELNDDDDAAELRASSVVAQRRRNGAGAGGSDDDDHHRKEQRHRHHAVTSASNAATAPSRNDSLYGDVNDANVVDLGIIESYGKVEATEEDGGEEQQRRRSDRKDDVILANVPELSKWERDDASSPADEQRTHLSRRGIDDKKVVTSEILKRAENALFQKSSSSSSKSSSRSEAKPDVAAALPVAAAHPSSSKTKDDVHLLESNAREARKSGNSIQVTVAAAAAAAAATVAKSDEDNRLAGRISAKDRLGAKVVDGKNYGSSSTVRSLVESKIKPRSVSSTVKCVAADGAKHQQLPQQARAAPKAEAVDKPAERYETSRSNGSRSDEKRRREKESAGGHHGSESRGSKSHPPHPAKEKRVRVDDEPHHAKKEKERVKVSSKEEDGSRGSKENAGTASAAKTNVTPDPGLVTDVVDDQSKDGGGGAAASDDVKSLLEKKRPCLDEASFEPDYDLTSESEDEKEKAEERRLPVAEPEESSVGRKADSERATAAATAKPKDRSNEATSSESSSESSSDSSAERRKRKKRKSKKKKKVKKRKTYSSDSESEESSDSDSDSDTKSKRKKKHKHKTKKTSKSAKKKKRTKHR